MPFDYSIQQDMGVIVTVGFGVVTNDDIIEHSNRITQDPRHGKHMRECCLLEQITAAPVSELGLRGMVEQDYAYVKLFESYSLAIVAPGDLAFGLARMYQALAQDALENVTVFRDRPAAVDWLGLNDNERLFLDREGEKLVKG